MNFADDLNRCLKYATEGLNGLLVDSVLRPKKGIDTTAMGVLGDHLQEIGSPLGRALSHAATGGELRAFKSLSGDAFEHLQADDGQYQVLGRKGTDGEGRPVLWVSLSKWKKVALDNGNTRLDKVKSHHFAVPAEIVPEAGK